MYNRHLLRVCVCVRVCVSVCVFVVLLLLVREKETYCIHYHSRGAGIHVGESVRA